MTALGVPLLASLIFAAPEPSLVELYSSEGCSSCPSAESLLRERGAADEGMWVLEFHVDYWNSLGWRDPFSTAEYSERQNRYAGWSSAPGVYTPQAIVDGRETFVGSDEARLDSARAVSGKTPKKALDLNLEGAQVTIAAKDGAAGELWVAVTESGLSSKVERGENRGRVLRHAPVVRAFTSLGTVPVGPLAEKAALKLDPRWKRENLRVVAAVQDPKTGAILALGQTRVR